MILCENELGALAAYVSCIQNRVVPILLDAKIDKNLLYNIVEAYKPDYVICKDGCHGDLGEATYSLGDDVGTYKVVKQSLLMPISCMTIWLCFSLPQVQQVLLNL